MWRKNKRDSQSRRETDCASKRAGERASENEDDEMKSKKFSHLS